HTMIGKSLRHAVGIAKRHGRYARVPLEPRHPAITDASPGWIVGDPDDGRAQLVTGNEPILPNDRALYAIERAADAGNVEVPVAGHEHGRGCSKADRRLRQPRDPFDEAAALFAV